MVEFAYVDTSCLLKLLIHEAETPRIQRIVDDESAVVISALTHLEARSRLLGMRRGGSITHQQYRDVLRRLDGLFDTEPFRLVALPGSVFEIAVEHLKKRGAVHCRSLDRLHLAAMTTLGAKRLITTDNQQARAARSLSLTVLAP